jgi:branched-chain amino acid transport system substrate-binding protein
VAQKYGCVFLNTNSSSPTEAGARLPPHQVRVGRQRHQLRARHREERDQGERQELGAAHQRLRLGHQTSKATRTLAEANGAKIVDELMIPQNTRDFSAFLIKLQQLKPQVVRPRSAATTSRR